MPRRGADLIKRTMPFTVSLRATDFTIQAFKIDSSIGRGLLALGLPNHFRQALHQRMLRGVRLAVLRQQICVALLNTRRLVDGMLLADRQMQA